MTHSLLGRTGVVLLAALAVLATGACSRAPSSPPPSALSGPATDLVTNSGDVPGRIKAIGAAEKVLTENCMRLQGFVHLTSTDGAGTDAYDRALFGDMLDYRELDLPDGSRTGYPSTGCAASSRRTLYGTVDLWARVDAIPAIINKSLATKVEASREHIGPRSTELAMRRQLAQELPPARQREMEELATAHCAAYLRARAIAPPRTTTHECRRAEAQAHRS